MDYALSTIVWLLVLYAPIWIYTTAKKNTEKSYILNEHQRKVRVAFSKKKPYRPEGGIGWEDTETYHCNKKI